MCMCQQNIYIICNIGVKKIYINEGRREEICLLLTQFKRTNYFFNDFTLVDKKNSTY